MNKIKLLTGLACLSFSGIASAVLISPSSAAAGDPASGLDVPQSGGWQIQRGFNLSGLSSLDASELHAPTNSGNGGRVLSAAGGAGSILFDLGGSFTIDGLALWNGGEDDRPGNGRSIGQRDRTRRGIAMAEVFTTVNGTDFVSQGSFSFTREFFNPVGLDVDSTDPAVAPIAAQVRSFGSAVTGVTAIRLDAVNFTANGPEAIDTIINFSEIAFNQVPEPSSALLGALGLGLMVVRRKR